MTSPRRVVAMLLLVALPHLAGIDRAAVLAWSDSFTDGVDTSRWSFPLNGSCWRMDKGITFEDASTIYARRPGITLNLYNTPHDCPSSSARDHHQAAAKPAASSRSNIVVAGERAAAIGSQIEAACTPGPAIFDMHHRQPSPADAGALAFFSMFREDPAGCALQLLFGYKSDAPDVFTVSVNGRTKDGSEFKHVARCTYPSHFDPRGLHKYTIHWNGDRISWEIDGAEVYAHKEPAIPRTCSCVAPYVILRADGDAQSRRVIEWEVDEVAVYATNTSDPRLASSKTTDFACVPVH